MYSNHKCKTHWGKKLHSKIYLTACTVITNVKHIEKKRKKYISMLIVWIVGIAG